MITPLGRTGGFQCTTMLYALLLSMMTFLGVVAGTEINKLFVVITDNTVPKLISYSGTPV